MAAGNGNPDHEMVVEAAYRIQLTKFAWVEPDVQWVIKPAGTNRIPDALVIGTEMGVVF
jgi:porin